MGVRIERFRPSKRLSRMTKHEIPASIESASNPRFMSEQWTFAAPVEQMVGRPIFGYGAQSWHPYRAAAEQLLRDFNTPYESSVLSAFYQTFQPATISSAHFLSGESPFNELPALSLFEPWFVPPPPNDDPFHPEFPSGSPLTGPLTDAEARAEWRRLKARVRSVREYGYQPRMFPRGLITVSVLRCDGTERYLVRHGQHRAAILAAMGESTIEVGFHGHPTLIDEAEVALWPYVRSGFVTPDQAIASLRRYFAPPPMDPALLIADSVESKSSRNRFS